MDQRGSGDAAPPGWLDGVVQGDVIGHDDDTRWDALGGRQFRGKAEIQPVGSVVLDDQHGARRTRGGTDRGQHGVGTGRGEHVAGDRRGQHSGADVTGMGGLVSAAAAG